MLEAGDPLNVRVEESVMINNRRESQNSMSLGALTPNMHTPGRNSTRPGSEMNFWESSVNRAFSIKSMSYDDLRRAFQAVNKPAHETPTSSLALDGSFKIVAHSDGVDSAPAGELMQTIAATVVQCAVRRLIAKKIVRQLKKKKQEDFEAQCEKDAEEVAATQIQQAIRQKQARSEVAALRGNSGEFGKLGIATSAATRKSPTEPAANVAAAEEHGGGDLMRECAAELIQSSFRKHRVNKRVEARSRMQSFAVEENEESDAELTGETQHVDAAAKNPPLSARLRNKVGAAREPGEAAAPSFLGWGHGDGKGLTAVFEAGEDHVLNPANASRPLWGIRALHAASTALQAPNFLPKLAVKRWVEGPLGNVMTHTAVAAAQAK